MATREDIIAGLKSLLTTDTERSKMIQIGEVYKEIIELQEAGVRMKYIEARLNERGFALKPGNLTSYLSQIRKKKGIQKTRAAQREPNPKKTKQCILTASPVLSNEKKTLGMAAKPKKRQAITSDEVKNSFSKVKDFSRYDD
ncbi:hypothetical protein [Polaromonas glacialis]|uniref:hypothetical protein n=1 Tax=Polaromonas glacialis TaxID=866564 RepID=UPI0012EC6260|nr:hypothetical protein [Polaromonas glacialis]